MEKTLTINKTDAIRLYSIASAEFKKELEETFGKKNLSIDITERIKTLQDACDETGEALPVRREGETDDELAFRECKIFTRALNGDWKPNWNDTDQKKWFNIFNMCSGFGFSYSHYGGWHSVALIGSRLCFKDEKTANYAGKQFISYYKRLLN